MILIEAAVASQSEAESAVAAGADRLELCEQLEVGGVTPSVALFESIRVAVPVWVLIRPRAGNFIYTEAEFAQLKHDAAWFLDHGASGIVTGILNADGAVDALRSAEVARLATGRITFHRAFDETPDPLAALEAVIDCGYRRILTSGGAATAIDGVAEIAALVCAARGRIEILPGGGVSPANALDLIRRTGCTQLHGSFRCGASTTDAARIRELKKLLSSAVARGWS